MNLRTHPTQIIESLLGETWLPVSRNPWYFVSDFGRVCSIDRVINNRTWRGQLLKLGRFAQGHRYVCLNKGDHSRVHVLVLEAFVGPRPEGQEGLHWDDNASNNHLSNLRWGTRSANHIDALRNGKKPTGEQMGNAKLTDEAVRFIHAHPEISNYFLGKRFGVSDAAIRQVRQGKTWKHVA